MGLGSGIAAQFGFAQESTVGTLVTVTKFVEFNSETLDWTTDIVQGRGLHASGQYDRSSRYARTTKSVAGDVNLNLVNKGLGVLLKNMLGSTATPIQIAASTAYKQTHNPGALDGLGLSMQKGTPEPASGTVKAYTYNGCKVSNWTVACNTGEIATLSLGIDAWNEDDVTALATASYATGVNEFNFTNWTVKLGGTPSIASGITSIAGGSTVSGLKSFEVTGTNPVAADRFFLGSAGVKANQLENGFRAVTGKFSGEFNKTVLYDVMKAGTTTAVQITGSFGDAGSSNPFLFDFVLPACKLNTGTNNVSGPDLVMGDIEFVALDDQATTPVQIQYVSTDTSL